jgi:peptidyl-tRNA hydrolase ICT1
METYACDPRVSSKATLRLPLDEFLALVPPIFHSSIRASPCYAKKSDSILIQADGSRRQSENSHACLVRLHRLVADAGAAVLPGETSEEQKEHVQRLCVMRP